jgi:hypothetical protein
LFRFKVKATAGKDVWEFRAIDSLCDGRAKGLLSLARDRSGLSGQSGKITTVSFHINRKLKVMVELASESIQCFNLNSGALF